MYAMPAYVLLWIPGLTIRAIQLLKKKPEAIEKP